MNRDKTSVITQLCLIMRFVCSFINVIDIIINMEDQSFSATYNIRVVSILSIKNEGNTIQKYFEKF